MIGYITLGTNDFERAIAFYDALFEEISAKRVMENEGFVAWGQNLESTSLSILRPFNKEEATAGNGSMVALNVETKEKVSAVYKKALELGGTDEGKPGFRGDSGFYAAYFRDLDGHKLNAFCFSSS